jgi:DNA helicase II / ATP-dependent DNA helicase PcrA
MTIVSLVDRLLKADPSLKVKLLTFSRPATAELAEKVAGSGASVPTSTFHSHAISVLLGNPGSYEFPSPLRTADEWETKNVVLPTLAARLGVPSSVVKALFKELSSNWESLDPREDPDVSAENRARFMGAWKEHRQVFGYTLPSELPYGLLQALKNHPDLAGVDHDLLVVDEYQDLNACDLEVLRLCGERGVSILGVGDDDQSVYSFRKAAPEGIRRFLSDFSAAVDYTLTVTQRCGRRIVDWARHVISGDPDRPPKAPMTCAAQCSDGEVGLLSFRSEKSEAKAVAAVVKNLIERENVKASEILILFRGDYNQSFSKPIRKAMTELGIPSADPDAVARLCAEPSNRMFIAAHRLRARPTDSLAWATILRVTPGVGDTFFNYIYGIAKDQRRTFAEALLAEYQAGFPGASVRKAALATVDAIQAWLVAHPLPEEEPDGGWQEWMLGAVDPKAVPSPTVGFINLLGDPESNEKGLKFDKYVGQLELAWRDKARAKSEGVRFMTMQASKGLTVEATIVVGVDEGIVPRPDAPLDEERRLLYVAMTRARKYLYLTWARQRKGPTARSGTPRVGGRRSFSNFLEGGPVSTTDGETFLGTRWP